MSFKICFWDEKEGVQKERDSTPEEDAQMLVDIAENEARSKREPEKSEVQILKEVLIQKGVLADSDLQAVKADTVK